MPDHDAFTTYDTERRTEFEMVDVSPGWSLKSIAELRADFLGEAAPVLMTVELVDGRYRVTQICVGEESAGHNVTSDLLRRIPVARILQDAVALLLHHNGSEISGLRDAAKSGPTDEVLKLVAGVYQAAQAASSPPVQFVAEMFDINRRRAADWTRRARLADYLKVPGGDG